MKKSKILFILHIPPPIHGSSIVGKQISESKVINSTFDCRYINLSTSDKLDDIGKKAYSKLFRYISILWRVFKSLLIWKPDLFYIAITAKGPAFYKDATILILAKMFRVNLLYHFHNKGVSSRHNNLFDNLLYRLVFKNAKIILLSDHLFTDIKKYVSEKMVFYCPNGVPEKPLFLIQNSDKKSCEILFLSNLFESKGLFILLDACKILINKGVKFHCKIVGGGGDIPEKYFYGKILEENLHTNLTYLGARYNGEKESIINNSDILVHPTYNDCFPLVLLEAMQYSKPIVSTFEGGIPDIVDDEITGFLVPRRDAVSLAEKLEILIKDASLRKKMGEAGRLKFEKEFTVDKFEKRLLEILQKVID